MLLTTKKRNPLSTNQPSNNWAQLVFRGSVERVGGQPADCKFNTLKHCLHLKLCLLPINLCLLEEEIFPLPPLPPPPLRQVAAFPCLNYLWLLYLSAT